jgi:hypothetical protein
MAQQALAQVVGLKALMKDVNGLCKDERSALFAAMKKAGYTAVLPVVGRTRSALPVADPGRVRRPGALAASLRASAYRSGAAVRMGSKAEPYAGPVDFGGYPGERPYLPNGRYLFPAAEGEASRAVSEYSAAINDLFGRTAIWSNSTANPESVHD